MSIDFSSDRLSYEKGELVECSIPDSPFVLFDEWLKQAIADKVTEPYAMSIATCGIDMRPSVRTVLMREAHKRENDGLSIVFYTNYDSSKGVDLDENNNAEVLFFWHALERQVRITGHVHKLSEKKSSEYFHKRPHTSQLAAWASTPQSGVVTSRDTLDAKFEKLLNDYPAGTPVPKPAFWGGYELVATQVEFWQGRASRMHDRIQYSRQDTDTWKMARLMP